MTGQSRSGIRPRKCSFHLKIIPAKRRMRINNIVVPEIRTGNQTGAIQGFGIRKSTSVEVSLGGHLIRI